MFVRSLLAAIIASMTLSACVTDRTLGEGLSDTNVDLSLKNALLRDTNYDTSDIDITVFEGRVMLTGTARSLDARRELSLKAQTVVGVDEVINEVIVGSRTGFGQGTRDALIDRKLANALRADNGIFRHNYQFAVSGGTVYILGIAQNSQELSRVVSHAQVIEGVKNVVPHIVFVRDPRRPVQ